MRSLFKLTRVHAILLVLALFVTSCAEDDQIVTPGTASSTSKVEHNYTGAQSGKFKVTGAYPAQEQGAGVTSTLSADRKEMTIKAVNWTKNGSESDFIILTLSSATAIQDNQSFTLTTGASGRIGLGLDFGNYDVASAYAPSAITITTTTVKDDQVKGNYSGTFAKGSETIVVTDGQFDIKY